MGRSIKKPKKASCLPICIFRVEKALLSLETFRPSNRKFARRKMKSTTTTERPGHGRRHRLRHNRPSPAETATKTPRRPPEEEAASLPSPFGASGPSSPSGPPVSPATMLILQQEMLESSGKNLSEVVPQSPPVASSAVDKNGQPHILRVTTARPTIVIYPTSNGSFTQYNKAKTQNV